MSLRLFIAIPIPEGIADRLLTLETDVPGASLALGGAISPHPPLHRRGRRGDRARRRHRTRPHRRRTVRHQPVRRRQLRRPGAVRALGRRRGPARPCAGWPPRARRAIRNAGLPPESRKYKPHVTLAYLNGTLDHEVAHFLSDAAEFRTDAFLVDHFCMYASRANASGQPLHRRGGLPADRLTSCNRFASVRFFLQRPPPFPTLKCEGTRG